MKYMCTVSVIVDTQQTLPYAEVAMRSILHRALQRVSQHAVDSLPAGFKLDSVNVLTANVLDEEKESLRRQKQREQ